MSSWYCYIPGEGYDCFPTAGEAETAAAVALEDCRNGGEWLDRTEEIEWGRLELHGCAVVVEAETGPHGRVLCVYELQKPSRTSATEILAEMQAWVGGRKPGVGASLYDEKFAPLTPGARKQLAEYVALLKRDLGIEDGNG